MLTINVLDNKHYQLYPVMNMLIKETSVEV